MTALTNDAWENRLLNLANEAWQSITPVRRPPEVDAALLERAYRHSASLTALHSRSFYMASALLETPARRAIRALYAFCRTADDIVDESGANAAALLHSWRERAFKSHPSESDLVALAWADTRARHQVPKRYAEQLLDGVAHDLNQVRYRTFDELATYCYGVASTVGLMSMHIIGYESQRAIRYAVKLGVALQLTNILRDVAEDWRRDRLYLPQEELEAFGLEEHDLAAGRVDDRWREFMRFQIARARTIYDEAWPGIRLLAPKGRLAVSAAAVFYRAILDDIEAHDYDVFTRRAYVGTWGKVSRLPSIWWQTKRG
ncbi:MAG: squalene/phytoene synthase family protein [Chloroflexota bacterium]|nr:MAG: squalene/phytoene synthase family protein [Chloroflexota bacterium]